MSYRILALLFIKGPASTLVLSCLCAAFLGYMHATYFIIVGWSVIGTIAFLIWSRPAFIFAFNQAVPDPLDIKERVLLVAGVAVQMAITLTLANSAIFYLVQIGFG